jgi:pimeloyl-ACP methyl ester carboxylesterase
MVDIDDRESPTARNDTTAVAIMPPLPVGTHFLDRLRLLHPRTWWHGYQLVSEFASADMELVRSSLLAIFLPALTLGLINGLLLSPAAGFVYSNSLLVAYLASPWNVVAGRNLWQGAQLPASLAASWMKRSVTLPEAYQVLQEQLDSQEAYRRRRYDVYLPSNNQNNTNTSTTTTKGILFLPGALVEHTAYSEVATDLSQNGNILVAVISLEPTRLSSFLSTSEFKAIQRKIQKEHDQVTEWIIAGHSMGAKRALELAAELNFLKVVLWGFGGYFFLPALERLATSAHCLILNGSKDGLVERMGGVEEFEASLPFNVHHTLIQGGSHQNFGTYKPQFNKFSTRGTDIADIPRHEQHAQVSSLTTAFVWRDF